MSRYSGTDEPTTFAEALVAIAQRVPFGSSVERDEVVLAIQTEYDIVPAKPEPRYADPRDETLTSQQNEIEELRRQLDDRKKADRTKADADELARLRAELASGETTVDTSGPFVDREDEPTKAQLKDELAARGLPVSGTKDELAQRLADADAVTV